MKKCAGIILGLAMVFAFLPTTGFAAEQGAGDPPEWGPVLDEAYEQLGGVDITSDQPEDNAAPDSAADRDKGAYKGDPDIDPADYSYEITPLLEPFNHYFFVKTDNPNPKTFQFVDKTSVYGDNTTIYPTTTIFSDIRYEDEATGRVNGGYILYGGDTDGGQITLQTMDYPGMWYGTWTDADVTLNLPALVDNVDYLINTYATKGSFFDNMDAVQAGLDKICLYSGSFIRGEVVRSEDYWSMGTGHPDQGLYIYSPFKRDNSKSLFASAIYPYRYDSLGFPGLLGRVSQRLDSSSKYVSDSFSHSVIHVTYNGETKLYGGQGSGKGQGISEDKILKYFSFGAGGTRIDFDESRNLLLQYGAIKMDDDIPRDDELTWEQIYDTIGDGAWGRIGDDRYIYMYPDGPGTYFRADEWSVGNSVYFWGDLGYAQDCWVDGRYVTKNKIWKKGYTFNGQPTAAIILSNCTIPQITYNGNTVVSITEVSKTVKFVYENGVWTPGRNANYQKIASLVQQGSLDQKYLDMVTLTEDEVRALQVDRNTNIPPGKGFFYDGNYPAGTPFDDSITHYWGKPKTVTSAGCETPGQKVTTCLICGAEETEEIPPTGHKWGEPRVATKPGCETPGQQVIRCQNRNCTAEMTEEIPPTGHKWGEPSTTIEPGCETPGKKVTTCLNCRAEQTEEIPPAGHKWGKATYKITKDYSIIKATRTCENDPTHVETENKETTEIITKEPTCEAPGEKIYRAEFDNPAFKPAKKTVEIPALGHKWGDGVITQYPTADADGILSFTCGNCGGVRTEPIPKDVDTITPSDMMADEAVVEESIPAVNTAKIKTTGNFTKQLMKVKFPVDAAIDNYRIQYRLAGKTSWKNGWSAGKDIYVIQGLKKSSLCEFRIAGYVKQADGSWARGAWSKVDRSTRALRRMWLNVRIRSAARVSRSFASASIWVGSG